MPPDLGAFILFALATSLTPGPNNIMVAAAAANHGVRATAPQMLGVAFGFGAMVLVVGLGLAGPLAALPALHAALRWVGGAWILWIAWGIARADPAPMDGGQGAAAPMRFLPMALFQWVNPKAWVMAVATTATYTATDRGLLGQVLVLAGLFTLLSLPSILSWSLLGAGAGRLLGSPRRLRLFNWAMAGLLVLSVLPLLAG